MSDSTTTDDRVDSSLVTARRARAADTHTRAKKALREVIASREPVTFAAVAVRAGVSREYLYRTPDLAHAIRTARTTTPVHAAPDIPAGEQPVIAALRDHIRRTDSRHEETLRALRAENNGLRHQLETALGAVLIQPTPCEGGRPPSGESLSP